MILPCTSRSGGVATIAGNRGRSSMVERQPSKLNVAGSSPVARFGGSGPEGPFFMGFGECGAADSCWSVAVAPLGDQEGEVSGVDGAVAVEVGEAASGC